MLKVTDEDVGAIKEKTGSDPLCIQIGKSKFMPLLPDSGTKIGQLDAKYFDPEKKSWTSTVAVMKYK
jgi:hypothetical protein